MSPKWHQNFVFKKTIKLKNGQLKKCCLGYNLYQKRKMRNAEYLRKSVFLIKSILFFQKLLNPTHVRSDCTFLDALQTNNNKQREINKRNVTQKMKFSYNLLFTYTHECSVECPHTDTDALTWSRIPLQL